MTGFNYIFIIWNKAFFCKDKILKDLGSSFLIRKTFYIRWSEGNFLKDLKAFYGTKTANAKEKARYVGKGPFYVIFVEDPDPLFEQRKTYNGSETVNVRIYDKKWLYRKWTGGNFRIHGSQNKKETEHDLIVLLGPDFMKRIDTCETNGIIETDTKGIVGYDSLQEFKDTLESFSRNVILEDQERVSVLSDCRSDLECFLELKQSDMYHFGLKVGDRNYDLCLLGEAEGDLPEGFLMKIIDDSSMRTDFLKIEEDYLKFLNDRLTISDSLHKYMDRYGFSFSFEKKDPFRKETAKSIFKRFKDELKYHYLIIREAFTNE